MKLLNHLRQSCRALLLTSACLLAHAAPALAATATQVSPANGTAGLPVSVTLNWKNLAGADGGDYEVLQGNTVIAGYGITYSGGPYRRTSETLSLDYGKTYKWRVRSRVLPQNNPWSDYWTFSTGPVPVPALVSPGNGVTGLARSVTLDWTGVSGSDGYDFEVQDGQNRTIAGYGINYTGPYRGTSVNLTFEYGQTYRWRARPRILPQNNPWSDWATFSIAADSTPKPPDVKPPDVKPPDVKPPDVKPPDVKPPDVKPPDVKPPDVKPPDVKPPDVKPPDVKPPDVKPPDVKPPDVKPPDVNPPTTPKIAAPTDLETSSDGRSFVWKNPPGNVRAVELYRQIGDAPYQLLATLRGGAESAPVDDSELEVIFNYKVRAQVGEVWSDFSEELEIDDGPIQEEPATAAARLAETPSSPGHYISPTWANFAGTSFGAKQKIVGTYYFYWYDSVTGQHLAANRPNVPYLVDSLTDHPAYTLKYTPADHRAQDHYYLTRKPATYNETSAPFTYRDFRWHRREFQQMWTGGIDFALANYWGNGDPNNPRTKWSNEGVERMNEALDRAPTVKLGLFFDTTTLHGVDLSTQAGVDQFYFTIRDFYSRVNPIHWARIDGKAVVWLYQTAGIENINPQVFALARAAFARDFGGTKLHIVATHEWQDKVGGQIDRLYRWGASKMSRGILAPGGPMDVVDIGPGHSFRGGEHWKDGALVISPQSVNPRRNGALYRTAWTRALQLNKPVVMIETWNEYHEGSAIAGTREYGSRYLNMTRGFARIHKSR